MDLAGRRPNLEMAAGPLPRRRRGPHRRRVWPPNFRENNGD